MNTATPIYTRVSFFETKRKKNIHADKLGSITFATALPRANAKS